MGAFVDIHAHILPGIDDGPDDLEQSLAMAQAAVESGIGTIASTPHLRPDFPGVRIDELAGRVESLRQELGAADIPLKVVPAAEVSLTWALNASDHELRLASYGQRGNDLLIETPTVRAMGIERLLYELRARGYRVILGHPERSVDLQEDGAQLHALVEQGVLVQINADSLLGPGPLRGPKRLARELLTTGLAHVIASDAHRGARWRPVTRLSEAVEAASDLVGTERARWMVTTVPQAIVDGLELRDPPAALSPQRRRRRWLGIRRH